MSCKPITPYILALKDLGYSYEHDKSELRFFQQDGIISSTIISFDLETKTVSKYRDVYVEPITMQEFKCINDILKYELGWIE